MVSQKSHQAIGARNSKESESTKCAVKNDHKIKKFAFGGRNGLAKAVCWLEENQSFLILSCRKIESDEESGFAPSKGTYFCCKS